MTNKTKSKTRSKPPAEPVRAPALTTPLADDAEILGALALAEIRPCAFNVRRHFDKADIAGLADSIRSVGLKERLLVRPIALAGQSPQFAGGTWVGVSHFELVDGERRFRALSLIAEKHELDTVPVVVRRLTDDQARGIMLASREQSRDLSVAELVAGYAELRANLPDDAALAALVGKPVAHVRSILRLGRLPRFALERIDRGELPRATAELVARIPGEQARQKAVACVILSLTDPRYLPGLEVEADVDSDTPLSYRDTKDLIRNHFQKELKGCPFDRKSLDLVPEAGSCEPCPKRAANDPEAQAEGTRGDVCLDPDCYAKKVAAYRAGEIAKAQKKGIEPAEIELHAGTRPPRGWCLLSDVLAHCELNHSPGAAPKKYADETLKKLLSAPGCIDIPEFLAFTNAGKPVLLVKTADARKALQGIGVLPKPEPRPKAEKPASPQTAAAGTSAKPSGPNSFDVENRTATIAADRCRTMLLANAESLATLSACGGPDTDAVYQALALSARALAYDWLEYGDDRREAVKRFVPTASSLNKEQNRYAVDKAVGTMTPAEVTGFILAMTAHVAGTNTHHWGKGLYQEFLDYADTNEHDCEQQARRELAPAEEKPAEADSLQTTPATPERPTVVLLAEIDGFPDAAFDTCFHAGITSLPTLLERMATEQPALAQMPLRNRVVAFLTAKLHLKIKPAEQAADAVAAVAELETSPAKPATKAASSATTGLVQETSPGSSPVGTPLAGITDFPAEVRELVLAKHDITTLEQLQAKQAEYAKQPGRAQISLYGVLRELGVPEKLVCPAGDALVDFQCDQIDAKEAQAKPAAKPKKKAGAK